MQCIINVEDGQIFIRGYLPKDVLPYIEISHLQYRSMDLSPERLVFDRQGYGGIVVMNNITGEDPGLTSAHRVVLKKMPKGVQYERESRWILKDGPHIPTKLFGEDDIEYIHDLSAKGWIEKGEETIHYSRVHLSKLSESEPAYLKVDGKWVVDLSRNRVLINATQYYGVGNSSAFSITDYTVRGVGRSREVIPQVGVMVADGVYVPMSLISYHE